MDRGQQADEGMDYDLPGVFCWASVNQPAIPQGNQKSVGKLPVIDVRSSGNTTLHGHSVKSLKDGDISRRLSRYRMLVMSSVAREVS